MRQTRKESRVQVLCAEYNTLLRNSQIALTNWNKGRTEIFNSGRRGRQADNELRELQASFAKAWALLQYHEHDCEICQLIAHLDGNNSKTTAEDKIHRVCN